MGSITKYGFFSLLFISILITSCSHKKDSKQSTTLFEQFYETPTLHLTMLPNTKFCDRTQIDKLITSQRYQKIWDLLEDCLAENAKDPEILKTKVIALLEANQLQLARASLIKLIAHESYFSEAIWLTALSWVKEEDYVKARRVLTQLPDGSEYLAPAKKLTSKLVAIQQQNK